MKLAVISANGRSRHLIVKEAINRKLDVTAIGRNDENKTIAKIY